MMNNQFARKCNTVQILIVFAMVATLCSPAVCFAEKELRKLVIAGTGDSQVLLRNLASIFEKNHPATDILVPESIGSGGGIRGVSKGVFDLARTARPLKENERPGLTVIHFARSPIVFAAHSSVSGVENLDTEQVLGIYSGKYRNWQDVGGPAYKIYPIDRERGDSSRIVLGKTLVGFNQVASKAKIFHSTPEAVEAISQHKYTIGFLPLSVAKKADLNVVNLNQISPIDPEYFHVTPFYIVSKGKPTGLAAEFIHFLFSEKAQNHMKKIGVIPVARETF